MALAVVVSPSTGNLATMAELGVSCVLPPKGMSTVAAPMVESKRSERPLLEATLRSVTSEVMRSASVVPAQLGCHTLRAHTWAIWCLGAPLELRNSRDRSTMATPFQAMRMRGSAVTSAITVASRFSSAA